MPGTSQEAHSHEALPDSKPCSEPTRLPVAISASPPEGADPEPEESNSPSSLENMSGQETKATPTETAVLLY